LLPLASHDVRHGSPRPGPPSEPLSVLGLDLGRQILATVVAPQGPL
jgi:hypothetical protein